MADLGGVVFDDYSADVLDAMHDAVVQALERCGEQAEGYAKDLTPVDTGNLRNSITHQVDDGESTVYIGTNVEYAPYVELGTGRYTEGGRPNSGPVVCPKNGRESIAFRLTCPAEKANARKNVSGLCHRRAEIHYRKHSKICRRKLHEDPVS